LRVVDDQSLDRIFSKEELEQLVSYEDSEDEGKTSKPKVEQQPVHTDDPVTKNLFLKHFNSSTSTTRSWIKNFHLHESMLKNSESEKLTPEEQRQALRQYEEEIAQRPWSALDTVLSSLGQTSTTEPPKKNVLPFLSAPISMSQWNINSLNTSLPKSTPSVVVQPQMFVTQPVQQTGFRTMTHAQQSQILLQQQQRLLQQQQQQRLQQLTSAVVPALSNSTEQKIASATNTLITLNAELRGVIEQRKTCYRPVELEKLVNAEQGLRNRISVQNQMLEKLRASRYSTQSQAPTVVVPSVTSGFSSGFAPKVFVFPQSPSTSYLNQTGLAPKQTTTTTSVPQTTTTTTSSSSNAASARPLDLEFETGNLF
jgi:hypothetical protein